MVKLLTILEFRTRTFVRVLYDFCLFRCDCNKVYDSFLVVDSSSVICYNFNDIGWSLQKFWALLYSLFIVGKAPENHGKAIYLCGKLLLTLIKPKSWRYNMWRFCERQMSKYKIADCQYVTELCAGPHYMKNEYNKEWFQKAVRVDFEGHQLPIPVGYNGYLRMAFGDYMQLPAVEKQVCHHEFEVVDMDNSYKIYRGKRYFINGGVK